MASYYNHYIEWCETMDKEGRRSSDTVSWDKEITCETQLVTTKMREYFMLPGN